MIRTLRMIVLSMSVLACAATATADETSYIFEGSDEAMWIVRNRPGKEGQVFDLVAKQQGNRWRWVAKAQRGRVSHAAASGGELHVFFDDGSSLIFFQDGSLNQWSTGNRLQINAHAGGKYTIRAACSGRGVGNGRPLLIVSQQTPTTAPATAPSLPVAGASLKVMQYSGDAWKSLAQLGVEKLDDDARVVAAVADGKLAVLLMSAGGQDAVLQTWSDKKWTKIDIAPPSPSGARAIDLLVVSGQITIPMMLEEESSEANMQLAVSSLEEAGKFVYQPVNVDGKPLTWPKGSTPLVSRFGDKLAIMWELESKFYVATGDPSGTFVPSQELEVFDRQVGDTHRITGLFLWGLMLAIMVVLLTMRPRSGPVQLALPMGLKPAPMPKRFLAAALDMLPFPFLMFLMFPEAFEILMKQAAELHTNSVQQLDLSNMIMEQAASPVLAYWALSWLVVYTLYSTVMEKLFGATAGKMLMRIRVVGYEGNGPDLREVLMRNLLRLIPLFVAALLPLLVVFPLMNPNRQRLGDLLARTVVVDARFKVISAPPEQEGLEQAESDSSDDDSTDEPPDAPPEA